MTTNISLSEMGINMNDMDEKTIESMRVEMSPDAIPDIDKLIKSVNDLLNDHISSRFFLFKNE